MKFFISVLCLSLISLEVIAQNEITRDYFPPVNYGGRPQIEKMALHEIEYTDGMKEGNASVLLLINDKGSIVTARVFTSSASNLNKEALRVANLMLWKPGIRGGERITSEVLLKIPFRPKKQAKLEENKKAAGYARTRWGTSSKIYAVNEVDKQPRPIYPKKSFSTIQSYIVHNFKYPPIALKYSIEGMVVIEFIVEPKGYISNPIFRKELGGGCDVEVLKILDDLYFEPGMKEGEYVRTKMRIVVPIRLPDSQIQLH